MIDRVLHQRLQQQRGHGGQSRQFVEIPFHTQAIAQAQLLHFDVLAGQLQFPHQRGATRFTAETGAEQVGEVVQYLLRLLRLIGYQADDGIQAVEEKVGPDA